MKKILLFYFLLINTILSFGDVIFDSSNLKPAINEPFTLQVKFLNEDKKEYTIEGIENLQVLSKGSQSKYSYVNGEKTNEKIDIYTVMGTELKNFPLTLNIDGKKINTLNLEISKENIKNLSSELKVENSLKNGDTFYFGEKIPYEESFLTTINLSSIGYNKLPTFNNFSEKDLNNGQYTQSYFRDSSGKQGLKINLYRGILQANSSGEQIINPGQIVITKSSGRRDFFFEAPTPPQYFSGENIKLNILPLPTNQPLGFQNVVGKPKIKYNWNSEKINLGNSLVLTLKISGEVNLDSLEKIINQSYSDFNTFESVKDSKEDIIDGKYYAEKNFEIAFIPKKSGENIIPEITIPYFNTETKSYQNLKIPAKKIEVVGNNSQNNITPLKTPQNENKNEVKNTNIEDIKISTIPDSQNNPSKEINYFTIGLIILVILETCIIIFLIFKRNYKFSYSELTEMKKAKNNKEFYEGYCKFMKNKYNFSPKVHLEDRLVRLNLSKEIISINQELEKCYYNNIPINKKDILKRLKKELKNEK